MRRLFFQSCLLLIVLVGSGCGEPKPFFLLEGKEALQAFRFDRDLVLLQGEKVSLKLRHIGDNGGSGQFASVTSGEPDLARIVSSKDGVLVVEAGKKSGVSILTYQSQPASGGISAPQAFTVHVSQEFKDEDLVGTWRETQRLPFRCKGKEIYNINSRQYEMQCLYSILTLTADGQFKIIWVNNADQKNPPPVATHTGKWSRQGQFLFLDDPAGVDGSRRKSVGQLLWKDGKLTFFHYLHTMDGNSAGFVKDEDKKED